MAKEQPLVIYCKICKKEIKDTIHWVHCEYFGYHHLDECGGCQYPVGGSCIKKVPKNLREGTETVEEWSAKVREMWKKYGGVSS